MITQYQARRLRAISRFASKATDAIALANSLGISPRNAASVIAAIAHLVELVPPVKRGRPPKAETQHA